MSQIAMFGHLDKQRFTTRGKIGNGASLVNFYCHFSNFMSRKPLKTCKTSSNTWADLIALFVFFLSFRSDDSLCHVSSLRSSARASRWSNQGPTQWDTAGPGQEDDFLWSSWDECELVRVLVTGECGAPLIPEASEESLQRRRLWDMRLMRHHHQPIRGRGEGPVTNERPGMWHHCGHRHHIPHAIVSSIVTLISHYQVTTSPATHFMI